MKDEVVVDCTTVQQALLADAARRQAELANQAAAAQAVSSLLDLAPEAAGRVRPFLQDPATLPRVFSALGASRGGLSVEAIFGPHQVAPELDPILERFLAQVALNIALGEGGEDLAGLPAVQLTDLPGDPLQLFSFDSLRILTAEAVPHRGARHSLLVKLDGAEAAALRGNERAKAGHLRAFVHELAAQSGKQIAPADARVLQNLAMTL